MAPDVEETPEAPAPRRGKRRRSPLTWIGALLVAIGLGCLSWFVYEMNFRPLMDEKAAHDTAAALKDAWKHDKVPNAKIPASAIALIRIPEFGEDYEIPIVTGVTPYALSIGVGWFETTAKPGQVGNFAIAGHRGTKGPFVPLLELHPGSIVEIETKDAIYIYKLTNYPKDLTVDKHDTWVLDPVPGKPKEKPKKKLITLITCANLFHSPERSIAFGELTETLRK